MKIIASAPKVKFNMKQNEIMEMAKGLKGVGAADGTLKEISEYLGKCFGIDMKYIYNKSSVVGNRLNPARFLEKMVSYIKKSVPLFGCNQLMLFYVALYSAV